MGNISRAAWKWSLKLRNSRFKFSTLQALVHGTYRNTKLYSLCFTGLAHKFYFGSPKWSVSIYIKKVFWFCIHNVQILSKLPYNLAAMCELYFFMNHKGILSFSLHSFPAWIFYSLHPFPLKLAPSYSKFVILWFKFKCITFMGGGN